VRWKTVYRSGTTHKLTSTDVRRLDSLGIRFAYDLRSNGERHAQPNRLRDIADLAYRFRDHEDLPGDIRRMMQSSDTGAEHMREMMVRVYRQCVAAGVAQPHTDQCGGSRRHRATR